MKIVLASTSPRRKSLLSQAGISFDIVSPSYDEKFENLDFSYAKIEEVAYNKAKFVAMTVPQDTVIISADTVVVFNNKILLKPKNKENAFEMLKQLSGKKHSVVTAYAILCTQSQKEIISHVESFVEFAKLSDEQILNYIDNFKPLDKAGAYGLQELPDYFHAKTLGSANNVIGLPVEEILEDLKNF